MSQDNWAYCIFVMKRLRIVFLALFFMSARAWATASYVIETDMNFGTFIQTAQTASAKLSYAEGSAQSNLSGMVIGSSTVHKPFRPKFTANTGGSSTESLKFNSVSGGYYSDPNSNCTITVDSWDLQPKKKNSLKNGTVYRSFTVGATVHIKNDFCSAGTHTFYATLNWSSTIGSRTTSSTLEFPIHITFEAPLTVEETQGMSFGTFLSPSTTSTITLSPSGSYTTSGSVTFVDSNLAAGQFTVTGVGSRQVSITLPGSATLTNTTGQTMTADTFTSTPSGSFTLSGTGTGKTQSVNVGSTLHINSNQKAGNYTGTYPVIVSY